MGQLPGWSVLGDAPQRLKRPKPSWHVASVLRLITSLALLLVACAKQVESHCDAVCFAYRNCYDAEFDPLACEDRCEARYHDEAAYKDAVDGCYGCIAGLTCSVVVDQCASDCSNVLDDGESPIVWQ